MLRMCLSWLSIFRFCLLALLCFPTPPFPMSATQLRSTQGNSKLEGSKKGNREYIELLQKINLQKSTSYKLSKLWFLHIFQNHLFWAIKCLCSKNLEKWMVGLNWELLPVIESRFSVVVEISKQTNKQT